MVLLKMRPALLSKHRKCKAHYTAHNRMTQSELLARSKAGPQQFCPACPAMLVRLLRHTRSWSDQSWLGFPTPELQMRVTGPVLLLRLCHASILLMLGGHTQGEVQAGFAGRCNAGYNDIDYVMAAADMTIELCDLQFTLVQHFLIIALSR